MESSMGRQSTKTRYRLCEKDVWRFWMVAEFACLMYICVMAYVLSGWFSVLHHNSSILSESQDLLDYSLCDFNFEASTVTFGGVVYELEEVYAYVPAPCAVRVDDCVFLLVQPDFNFILKSAGNKLGYAGFITTVVCSLIASVLSLRYMYKDGYTKGQKTVNLVMMILVFLASGVILYIVNAFFM